MKTQILFIVMTFLVGCGQQRKSNADSQNNVQVNNTSEFKIVKTGLVINGKLLQASGLIDEYIKVLGNPDRILHKANDVFVWDNIGLAVAKEPTSTKVKFLRFCFVNCCNDEIDPKRVFTGKINIEDIVITNKTTINVLKKAGFSMSDGSDGKIFEINNHGNFSIIVANFYCGCFGSSYFDYKEKVFETITSLELE